MQPSSAAPTSAAPVKILVCGDVNGQIHQLFAKVEPLNRKAGPFAALFCVGTFLQAEANNNAELKEYISGQKRAPLPTFFLDGTSLGDEPLCENITKLGGYGNIQVSGLNVAYFATLRSNMDSPLDDKSKAWLCECVDVDVLLTTHWPSGSLKNLKEADYPKLPQQQQVSKDQQSVAANLLSVVGIGSSATAEIAKILQPRYHFAGNENIFYERPPYRSPSSRVTRFFGLGYLGNKLKQRFFYAASLTPLSVVPTPPDMIRPPPNTTPSPYHEEVNSSSALSQQKQSEAADEDSVAAYRWNLQAPPPRGGRGGRGGDSNYYRRDDRGRAGEGLLPDPSPTKRQRTYNDQEERGGRERRDRDSADRRGDRGGSDCWFCLKSPKVEKHLVVSVGETVYVALAKGGLSPDHVLIIPIDHVSSVASLPPAVIQEIQRYKHSLRRFFEESKGYKGMVCFERFLHSNHHCHVQVIPLSRNEDAERAGPFFEEEATKRELELRPLNLEGGGEGGGEEKGWMALRSVTKGRPYFLWETPMHDAFLHLVGEKKISMNLGREIAAALMGQPEKADWRQCVLTKEEEVQLAKDFKKAFRPFDWSMQ
ncbi:CWF19 like cell cycle control factor 1 [Balamuthia mandrillaris]